MSAFLIAYKIIYTQGCACLYFQHLVGWCKISSSQTKPTTNTTKYPKCVTASLTSPDSKEIRILWINQALCILKFHVYQCLQQRLENILYWGPSSVVGYRHSMYKIQLTLQKEEKNIYFISRHPTFYPNNCLPQISVFICLAAGSYFYLNDHPCSFCRDHSLHSEELSSGENSLWALVYRSWLILKA